MKNFGFMRKFNSDPDIECSQILQQYEYDALVYRVRVIGRHFADLRKNK